MKDCADGFGLEVHLRQRAGQELAVAVIDVDLNEQGAAGRIDGSAVRTSVP